MNYYYDVYENTDDLTYPIQDSTKAIFNLFFFLITVAVVYVDLLVYYVFNVFSSYNFLLS